MTKMFDANNPLRNLASQENLEIGRNLIISVSNAVAEAAAAARRNLSYPHSTPSAPTLRDLILAALKDGPLSAVTLRKRITELSAGIRPNQDSLKTSLADLIAEGFVAEDLVGELKVYQLTELGSSQITGPDASKLSSSSAKCSCGNHSLSTLKAAQRLSSVVLDVSTNGTGEQQHLAAQELEKTRTRILQILTDSAID